MRGVEDQRFSFVLVSVKPLDDYRSFYIDGLATQIKSRLGLVDILDAASRPGAVRQLVEKFSARLAGRGEASHPELLVILSGKVSVDGGEVGRAVVIEHAPLDQRLAIQVHHVARRAARAHVG